MTTYPAHATTTVRYQHVDADGVKVFYREAGAPDAPVILLLHGFPSSSHMYRDLIPHLATRYRVIAPDLPGFGFTDVPAERDYRYSFDSLAKTVERFVEVLGLSRYALYVFDYGAPVGLRLAVAHPERVTALISQNGNAYLEGLGDAWEPIRNYWQTPSAANREIIREAVLNLDGVRYQYVHGVTHPELIAPESYTLDVLLMQRPGNADIQLDLFLDYANNLTLYPAFQAFFKQTQVPALVIWGKHDPFFIPPGAEAYKRDNANAVIEMLDTGHFALETHADYIAQRIVEVLGDAIR
ncbi:alpha/beta hydrolase [Pseudomonas sp. CCI3.2]|uniref:alpha/beta fold hydrolase n=1 Tax=unclassified Pseudomonas TaxID=196821 RepID=UPI002AC95147|nr:MULTISPECIES: alpha/beta hydrolase [unclassified Pseudomonas]MEB0077660.1 alpha/beta hydrolase [Pseudomonas sp. MH10out]MEB0093904.1 alpha/beta hydrolase [Pseudomonas sp. CCI4.2]MEB0101346.1 alpha/beta hydrolase [Pseudomonas sp. CCI3.2]MEB0131453.1 alpha/beta hydrolase [Pseudomonas sp. CCI2.4]MEB0158463.1 alpha/beta hydrolase [Pseudomonas sp. AH2 (2023)]